MEIETKQRIKYLIEHGGLWEQAEDRNTRTHRWILAALGLVVALETLQALHQLIS
jgi:hypothetical protein